MRPRKLEWVVYHEPSFGTSSRDAVLELLAAAGYVHATTDAAGTYALREFDMDPRTMTRSYDLDVYEDPARPVIDRVKSVPAKKL